MARRKLWKRILTGTLILIVGLPLLVLAGAEIFLQSRSFTALAEKLAADYVDGDVHIGSLKASAVRSFPHLRVDIDDLCITYPHERFARFDSTGMTSSLLESGRAPQADTLASAECLQAALNYVSLLKGHTIEVAKLEGHAVRGHIHVYDSTASNLNVLKFSSSEDTSTFELPDIKIGRITLDERTLIVYTSLKDTLLASLGMQGLDIHEHSRHIDLSAEADVLFYMPWCGRLALPIGLDGEIAYPKMKGGVSEFTLHDFSGHVASLPLKASGSVAFHPDSTWWDVKVASEKAPVQEVISQTGDILPSVLHEIKTDAKLTLVAESHGWQHAGDRIMPITASVEIPEAKVDFRDIMKKGKLDFSATADISRQLDIDVDVKDLCASTDGIDISLGGRVKGLTSGDPLITLERCCMLADLAKAVRFAPKRLGIKASGDVDLDLEGTISMSQLTSLDIADADLNGRLTSDGIRFSMPADTIAAVLGSTELRVASMNSIESGRDRAIGLLARIDTVNAQIGGSMHVTAGALSAVVQNSAKTVSRDSKLHPLLGSLTASRVRMEADSLRAGLKGSKSTFRITAVEEGGKRTPKLSVGTENERLFVRAGAHRVMAKGVSISADAQKRVAKVREERSSGRRKAMLDSLRKIYPDVSRDSLKAIARGSMKGRQMPSWMSEKEFRSKDIDIRLTGALASYFEAWKPSGQIAIESARVATPVLPLRNTIDGFKGSFTENRVDITRLHVDSGESSMSATGHLEGLRRALTSKGMLDLTLSLDSDRLNANELIAALKTGSDGVSASEALDDEAYAERMAIDTLANADATDLDYSLIVVPGNVRADLDVNARNVSFSDVGIDMVKFALKMKERTLQLTDGYAKTDLGNMELNAFYSTQTKKDIKAGFDLHLSDVTAEKVITIIPAVDSLVPELKSFNGMLNCELAATAQLDTNMNVVIPSLNGIVKIAGKDLTLEQTGTLKKVARLLMFKDKKVGRIDDMSIYGTIKDNRLEVFPFVLGIDRYSVALRGMQNFDQSFSYNASLVKSPILLRFGVDIYGPDFDHMKFKLGRGKYKSSEVPVFTSQVDTMQFNLAKSIRNIYSKGVDAAIRENEQAQRELEKKKAAMGYNSGEISEDLTLEEQLELDQLNMEAELEQEYADLAAEIDAMLDADLNDLAKIESQLMGMTGDLYKEENSGKKKKK